MKARAVPRVRGFISSGIHCGIKEKGPDLALIVSQEPASAAGVFTQSTIVGAPVALSRKRLQSGRARAVVVNSGVSNVAMGARGERDAHTMAKWAAQAVGCPQEQVLVASTGVIGEPLPMERLREGIGQAAASLSPGGLGAAAEAIRTTDTYAKFATRRFLLGGKPVVVAGIAKGSGMIEPNMATMLAFLLTDANVAPAHLRRVLRRVTNQTFNRVSVDGEESTSDSVIALAGGESGAPRISSGQSPGAAAFEENMGRVAEQLAMDLARDGEGATKLVTVDVRGARTAVQAERAARRIANSLLVKTALFGADPNWGRILQTVGAGQIELVLERVQIRLGGVTVFRRGSSAGPAARRRAETRMRQTEVGIEIELGAGRHAARVWTCDLSTDYVRINSEYTT